MSINQRLELRQGQSLTMTPQLQQAIKLLQLSNLELSAFVEAELEKNPLLERAEASAPPIGEKNGFDVSSPAAETPVPAPKENGAEESGYDYAAPAFSSRAGGSFDGDFSFESALQAEVTLRDHLLDQINMDFIDLKERAIAALMLDQLDESGYFRADPAALAARLGCEAARLEAILGRLQQLDPPGIFARSLSECLALQLKEKDRLDPAMEKLLQNLGLLAARDFKALRVLCGVDGDDLQDMIAEIRALDPKPALNFEHFVPQTVIPDVMMKPLSKAKGGGWAVELNNATLPRVLVNQTYYAEVSRGAKSRQDREYLGALLGSANWLVKAMDQRAQTILKVAGEIILQQEAFFNYGVEFLKPLVLADVAAAVGVHESTVSRVTANKYIGTPRGAFELKYFFSSGVANADGSDGFSAEAVKARIRALVEGESSAGVLSDDELVAALRTSGIVLARRTVAKYREAMKIPSSVQRRRLKNQE